MTNRQTNFLSDDSILAIVSPEKKILLTKKLKIGAFVQNYR